MEKRLIVFPSEDVIQKYMTFDALFNFYPGSIRKLAMEIATGMKTGKQRFWRLEGKNVDPTPGIFDLVMQDYDAYLSHLDKCNASSPNETNERMVIESIVKDLIEEIRELMWRSLINHKNAKINPSKRPFYLWESFVIPFMTEPND